MTLRRGDQFLRGITGVRDVGIEKRKVEPTHVERSERPSQPRRCHVGTEVVVHALAALAHYDGLEIQAFQQPESQDSTEIVQAVLVTDFDEVRAFLLQNAL